MKPEFSMTYDAKKKQYEATNGYATFYCTKHGNVLMIDLAWAIERNRGHGTNLMSGLLAWAKKKKLKVESSHPINPLWEKICKRFGITVHYQVTAGNPHLIQNCSLRAFYNPLIPNYKKQRKNALRTIQCPLSSL